MNETFFFNMTLFFMNQNPGFPIGSPLIGILACFQLEFLKSCAFQLTICIIYDQANSNYCLLEYLTAFFLWRFIYTDYKCHESVSGGKTPLRGF